MDRPKKVMSRLGQIITNRQKWKAESWTETKPNGLGQT